MKIDLNIPMRIDVNDYHEFRGIEEYFRMLNPRIRVKEISGIYSGVVYLYGTFHSPKVQAIVKEIKEEEN